jgi:hypothetical protein
VFYFLGLGLIWKVAERYKPKVSNRGAIQTQV